ncbi:MAG: helix-turn-helix transcriptional regulator, partial [Ruminococcus sp.]|nr:helix-turn-helix transcriptional regulator [Ruminococcus sp.]
NTDMRIQEIALQCGYNNESHFMRQFKEKCGSTAVQYRRRNR